MAQDLSHLPASLYSTAAVRHAEQAWATALNQPLYTLVEQAGAAAMALLQQQWPDLAQRRVLVVAGQGNNGADALVCLRCLLQQQVACWLYVAEGRQPTPEWQQAWQCVSEYHPEQVTLEAWPECDILLDGLLGTGVKDDVRPEAAEVIRAINQSAAKVVSLDLPSGMVADTGAAAGIAVVADMTLCMGAIKQGLLTGHARHCCGALHFADLGLTPYLPSANVIRVDRHWLTDALVPRQRDSHKGQSGKVTLMGGDYGMAGAIRLAAEACLRAGAGLVTVVSRPEHQVTINSGRPELMFHGCELVDMEVYQKLGWATVLVLGPGLGRQDWGYNLCKAMGLVNKPCVVDADALYVLAGEPIRADNWVLTPHSGEAARLLGSDSVTVEQDRFAAVRALQKRYGGVVLLKGAGTLIYDGKTLYVAPVGNPGLASGGCGDVLSGIIGALMAQGMTPVQAAVAGVIVHGEAADLAARDGERGMLASDLMPWIRHLVNPV